MVLDNSGTGMPLALWVVPVSNVGGVARHVLDCAKTGIPGWRLVVLCPPGYLAEELKVAGLAVVTGAFGPQAGMLDSLRTLHRTKRSLRPHLVHSHLSYADIMAAAALGFDRSTILVSTEHGIAGDDSIYHRSKVSAFLKARLHSLRLRRTDKVIAVSQATANVMRLKWRTNSKTVVIPNGVNATARTVYDPSLAESNQVPRLLSLSRLSAEKNIDVLLKSFPLILQKLPHAKLTIAGDGPEEANLHELASKLDILESIQFPGVVDPVEAMDHADTLVQLSSWENCSYTLLDAVSAGLKVIASNVGGNPEILSAGSLIQDATPESLADAVIASADGYSERPTLPEGWPTVDEMCHQISEIYASGHHQ